MTKSIDIEDIKHLRATISENIILTPVIRFKALERLFSKNTKIYTKLEFLQKTGTFKIRGALTSLIKLDSTQKKYGVCENCGDAIPVARLEALPYSTNCRDCAALIDT